MKTYHAHAEVYTIKLLKEINIKILTKNMIRYNMSTSLFFFFLCAGLKIRMS